MEHVKLFYLTNCPYCKQAQKVIQQLQNENQKYQEIISHIQWVEESVEKELADSYDYYYVPTIFVGETKKYEARPGESYETCYMQIKTVFDELAGE